MKRRSVLGLLGSLPALKLTAEGEESVGDPPISTTDYSGNYPTRTRKLTRKRKKRKLGHGVAKPTTRDAKQPIIKPS